MGEYGIYGGFLAGAVIFAAGFLFAVKFNKPQAASQAAQAVKKRRWNPKEAHELIS